MTPIQLALMIFGIMLLLMVVRVPIAGAMFLAGTTGFILQTGIAPFLNFLNNLAFARLANYDLSVIPLFILMGHFATQGGISKALFQFAAAVMGRFKGGLAMGATEHGHVGKPMRHGAKFGDHRIQRRQQHQVAGTLEL